jgi:hypothetical protein
MGQAKSRPPARKETKAARVHFDAHCIAAESTYVIDAKEKNNALQKARQPDTSRRDLLTPEYRRTRHRDEHTIVGWRGPKNNPSGITKKLLGI